MNNMTYNFYHLRFPFTVRKEVVTSEKKYDEYG